MTEKKVSAIGERALISLLSEIFKAPPGVGGIQEKCTGPEEEKEKSPEGRKESPGELLVGPGSDDCAVLDLNGEDCLVVTTDMLHRTTDFPEGMTPWQMGWMSAAVNLSDVAAMGARPIGLLVAIGMPADTEIAFVEELAKGIQACAEFCETPVIGGDLDTHEELTITGTALGRVKKSQLLRRSGAKPGDFVCVTGYTGSAGAALEILLGPVPEDLQSKQRGVEEKKASETLIKSLLEPVPRTHEARKLAASGAVTSMMDTSDGLAMSLHDLAKVSRVGFRVQERTLPILQEVRDFALTSENGPEKLLELALYTGGDFELLFTIDPEQIKKVQNICNLTIIGECIDYKEGILLERADGRIENVEQRGYQQLKAEQS